MSGTFDEVGVTCNDPARATQICQALRNGTSLSTYCNGPYWYVGNCGGVELSVGASMCQCSYSGHTVRPCISNENWGGVGTETRLMGNRPLARGNVPRVARSNEE